jgi:hypothetical protein
MSYVPCKCIFFENLFLADIVDSAVGVNGVAIFEHDTRVDRTARPLELHHLAGGNTIGKSRGADLNGEVFAREVIATKDGRSERTR